MACNTQYCQNGKCGQIDLWIQYNLNYIVYCCSKLQQYLFCRNHQADSKNYMGMQKIYNHLSNFKKEGQSCGSYSA